MRHTLRNSILEASLFPWCFQFHLWSSQRPEEMFELSVKRAGLCCCLSYCCPLLVVIYITTHISTTGHRLLNAFLFKFWYITEHKKCSWGYHGLSYACLSGFSAVCCIRVTVLQIHCSRQSAMHRKYPCFLFFLLLKKASGADALYP